MYRCREARRAAGSIAIRCCRSCTTCSTTLSSTPPPENGSTFRWSPGAEEKIFRKFYRVDTALEAEVSGFGLGLAIARGLLRDQKGELKAVPADPGMQFIIQLPEEPEHGTV